MERASTPARVPSEIDGAVLSAAMHTAAAAAREQAEPARAIDAVADSLHEALPAVFPSVFVLEHDRLWLVSQRGYAVVPDGIRVDQGVMGRAIRLREPQLVHDPASDPDYLGVLPSVVSELAVPLEARGSVVGMLNVESERPLPDDAAELVGPLAAALTPFAEALRARGVLDLAALARLFVHLGGLRDPEEIAGLAAASLARVLPLETSQVVVWSDVGAPVELAVWRSDTATRAPLSVDELAGARSVVDASVVSTQFELDAARGEGQRGSQVWFPLRSSGTDLGALVAAVRPGERVDPAQLDTAAVLAAHVAASLDVAIALQAERQSAVTDSLTGILNRRGLEEHLEREVALAQERRRPLSLLVIDCDDFKDINDRAGHEFGDTLLWEIAQVLVRSLPEGAEVARLGGDEFVVMLPGAGSEAALEFGSQLRVVLAEGLTDAGFPLHVSAGISTYPFDGAAPSVLLRAADQALYAAKSAGKDRVAAFADVVRPERETLDAGPDASPDGRRRSRGTAAALADVVSGSQAIDAERTVDGVCSRLCKWLVFVVGATACSASRVSGDFLVDASGHALREVSLGDEVAYRISDFPLTQEVLETGEPRAVSFLDGDIDPAEAFVLRELGMSSLLLLPLQVKGEPWGLVELYEMRMRRFTDDDVVVARFLVGQAERRLVALGADTAPPPRSPIYRLPPPDDTPRTPRTR
jgi:diguanylate cyclase (GGDEF)-like protein